MARSKAKQTIDCKSEDGVTIGLIDGLMSMAAIIATRETMHPQVIHALADLAQDKDVKKLMKKADQATAILEMYPNLK